MKDIILKLIGNRLFPVGANRRVMIGGLAPGEADGDAATFEQLSAGASSILIKGYGNSGTGNENGDYRLITNTDNYLVTQFYTGGAWDTDNENILSTPS